MIILSQDGTKCINFDNVEQLRLNEHDNKVSVIANFTGDHSVIIGTYNDVNFGKKYFRT